MLARRQVLASHVQPCCSVSQPGSARPFPARLRLSSISQRRPTECHAAAAPPIETVAPINPEPSSSAGLDRNLLLDFPNLSYSAQYDLLYSRDLDAKKVVPKPSKEAQMGELEARKVALSDVFAVKKRNRFLQRTWEKTDFIYVAFMVFMHGLALAAPFTFSWGNLALFCVTYAITGCLGITLSYHRQLSHRAFATPKWLEYALAYCGVLAIQGDPLEWVSSHRYHHLHTDTPLDPHSPYEGFWWSHMGWLLDNKATLERVGQRGNMGDLTAQPYYRFLQKTYGLHVAAQLALLYVVGGFPALVWGGAVRAVWVYHITWFVNSASHCWGSQDYGTGDLSRNNWWVALLAFGEGWHNNHHAFEFSARHGLQKWQLDPTWMVISLLQRVGLATDVKLPSTAQKKRLALHAAAE